MALGYLVGDDPDSDLVDPNTYGSAGFVIAIAALAIIMELVFIIVRICNIGLINLKIKIFLIIVSTQEIVHVARAGVIILLCVWYVASMLDC